MERLDRLHSADLDFSALLHAHRSVHDAGVPGAALQLRRPLHLRRLLRDRVHRFADRRAALRRRAGARNHVRHGPGPGHRSAGRAHRRLHHLWRTQIGRLDRLHADGRAAGWRNPCPGDRLIENRRNFQARRRSSAEISGLPFSDPRTVSLHRSIHQLPQRGHLV